MENLIASSDGPVLVDTEMLLQPVQVRGEMGLDSESTGESHDGGLNSCLETGLLSLIQTDPVGGVYDIGGSWDEPTVTFDRIFDDAARAAAAPLDPNGPPSITALLLEVDDETAPDPNTPPQSPGLPGTVSGAGEAGQVTDLERGDLREQPEATQAPSS